MLQDSCHDAMKHRAHTKLFHSSIGYDDRPADACLPSSKELKGKKTETLEHYNKKKDVTSLITVRSRAKKQDTETDLYNPIITILEPTTF